MKHRCKALLSALGLFIALALVRSAAPRIARAAGLSPVTEAGPIAVSPAPTDGSAAPAGPSPGSATRPAPEPGESLPSAYVGRQACIGCHPKEGSSLAATHLARSVVAAVPGAFDGPVGQASRIMHEGDVDEVVPTGTGYSLRITRSGRRPVDHTIRYLVGHKFGQRPVIELPGGRLAAANVYLDTRRGRWVHIQDSQLDRAHVSEDPGHPFDYWAGHVRSFGYACAGCHTSQAEDRFDPDRRESRFTAVDLGVNCECCHGPGAQHAARSPNGVWHHPGLARESVGRVLRLTGESLTNVCARCHVTSFRLTRTEKPGDLFLDDYWSDFSMSLLYPDGSPAGYLYQYVPFVQSLCFARGNASCESCHDPHGSKSGANLVAALPGDAVCASCHVQQVRQGAAHTHHPAGSTGASCVACHMRPIELGYATHHDHRIAPPVPELTVKLGIPNACTSCHAFEGAPWAAAQARRLWGDYQAPRVARAMAVARARAGDPGALDLVASTARDLRQPFMVRAFHLWSASRVDGDNALDLVAGGLTDPHPAVRMIAATALGQRIQDGQVGPARIDAITDQLARAAGDPVRAVRRMALESLARHGVTHPPAWSRWRSAIPELCTELDANRDNPFTAIVLAALLERLGEPTRAADAARLAIGIAGTAAPLARALALFALALDEPGLARSILFAPYARADAAVIEGSLVPPPDSGRPILVTVALPGAAALPLTQRVIPPAASGRFRIDDLPPGAYTLQAYEATGPVTSTAEGSTDSAAAGSTGSATGSANGSATGGSTGSATGGSTGSATSTGDVTGGGAGSATGGFTLTGPPAWTSPGEPVTVAPGQHRSNVVLVQP